jgi:uncharacterized membrane protein YwzB
MICIEKIMFEIRFLRFLRLRLWINEIMKLNKNRINQLLLTLKMIALEYKLKRFWLDYNNF